MTSFGGSACHRTSSLDFIWETVEADSRRQPTSAEASHNPVNNVVITCGAVQNAKFVQLLLSRLLIRLTVEI